MGWDYWLARPGSSAPPGLDQRRGLEEFVPTLPGFAGWKESGFRLITQTHSLAYVDGLVNIYINHWSKAPWRDIRTLVRHARTLGLAFFMDPDVDGEYSADEADEMLDELVRKFSSPDQVTGPETS